MDIDDEALIDELARVLASPDDALALLQRSGFPAEHVPKLPTAAGFWHLIVSAARSGALDGGVEAIAIAAAASFPENLVFRHYLKLRVEKPPVYRDRLEQARVAKSLELGESTAPPWPGKGSHRGVGAEAPPSDVGQDDPLWDTEGAAALNVLAHRVPTTTRGPMIIVGGRVRHQRRVVPRCPDCDGPLESATVSVRFELAADASAVQEVPGFRCGCGAQWPDPFAMRRAHAAAFGAVQTPESR